MQVSARGENLKLSQFYRDMQGIVPVEHSRHGIVISLLRQRCCKVSYVLECECVHVRNLTFSDISRVQIVAPHTILPRINFHHRTRHHDALTTDVLTELRARSVGGKSDKFSAYGCISIQRHDIRNDHQWLLMVHTSCADERKCRQSER